MKELIKNIISSKTCKKNKSYLLSKYFNEIIKPLNLKYVFNPSFYIDNKIKIISFRGIKSGKEIHSFVSLQDTKKKTMINISEKYVHTLGVRQLIDPKVTKLSDGIYVTFNSGWNREGNDIFIMKVYPKLESPKKVVYKNRAKYERNWAFFSRGKEVYALYWINPLKILKLKKKTTVEWEFEDYHSDTKVAKNIPQDLTLGTQLYIKDNKYYFMAHKKIKYKGKKMYFGKACLFDFENKKIIVGKKYMIHSFLSLLGSKFKTNSNLYSCTYFSGIQIKGNTITLGYGVNDIEAHFCEYTIKNFLK